MPAPTGVGCSDWLGISALMFGWFKRLPLRIVRRDGAEVPVAFLSESGNRGHLYLSGRNSLLQIWIIRLVACNAGYNQPIRIAFPPASAFGADVANRAIILW